MNDLAEKALDGLAAAVRWARAHPVPVLGAGGFVTSAVVVVAGSRVGAAADTVPLTTWLGLQSSSGIPSDNPAPGTVMLVGIAALVLVWLAAVQVVRRRELAERSVWALAAAWAVPFALGPPLVDSSIYSYTAFGLLQRAGHDPYTTSAAHLGYAPIVGAIDPGSRGAPSAGGPLATLIQHLAVSVGAGSALLSVLVFRVLGVLTVIWIGRLSTAAGGARPARALSLTVLNPLLLVYVVSAGHLEGLTAALALAAVVAADRRRWTTAVVLACLAGGVVATGYVAVAAVIAVHVYGRRSRSVLAVLGRDLATAAVTVLLLGLVVVRHGFGWAWTVQDQFSEHTPLSVAGGTAALLSVLVRDAPPDDLLASARVAAMIAAAVAVCWLVVTARRRALERTAGYALICLGLLAPALYPWYVLAGIVVVAPSADVRRKILVLGLSSAACLLMPAGFGTTATTVLGGCALLVVAAVTAVGWRHAARGTTQTDPAVDEPDGAREVSAGT